MRRHYRPSKQEQSYVLRSCFSFMSQFFNDEDNTSALWEQFDRAAVDYARCCDGLDGFDALVRPEIDGIIGSMPLCAEAFAEDGLDPREELGSVILVALLYAYVTGYHHNHYDLKE